MIVYLASNNKFVFFFQPEEVQYLLEPLKNEDIHKKCIVIDLDETLVHSSFKVILPFVSSQNPTDLE